MVRLHVLVPHGSGTEAVSAREPSCELLLVRGGAISLPVKVTDTEWSALMLTSNPSTHSLTWCALQAAGLITSRSGPPVPIAMVSCDERDL
jgi:hypothetical protein